jgi:signal transduction histidine kinase
VTETRQDEREAVQLLVDEQAALRRVATLVASGVETGPLFDALAAEVEALFGADISAVVRFEGDGTVTVMGAHRGPHSRGARAHLDQDYVVAAVSRTGQSAGFDLQDWEGEPPAVVREWGVRSAVATPVVVEGELWGAFTIASLESSLAAGTDRRLADFSALFATAIANAQSREALAALAEEQAALRRVATLVARDVSPSEIFAAVTEEVAGVFDSAAGVLRFEDGSAVVFVGVANIDIPIGTRWEFQEGMASAEVYRTGHSARVEEVDWSSVGGPVGEASRRIGTVSIVGSPIVVEGRLWGAMIVSSREDFLPLDTEARLEKFTELIGTAIANAATRQARAVLAEEQAALRRVATLVAEGAEPEAVFAAVAEDVAHVLDVALSAVARYEAAGRATQVGAWGKENPFPVGTSWKLDESSVSGRIAATRLPARVANYAEVPGQISTGLTRDAGIHSAVGAPIMVGGDLWGVMMALSTEDKPLPDDAETRLAAFTELIATAISNTTARTELIESRARIVAAGDEARRRIERDLHDGTQQRLVSLALAARAAAAELPAQSHDLGEKFSRIATGLGAAVEELQELSRGIHPAILSDAGLGPALEALALRSPIPVKLEVRTKERFPEPVEAAAYFVASESLANAAKHSRSSRIDVALMMENERLLLSVRDDGIGGADPGRGSGLVGLRDRVEALGGSLEITSKLFGGTSLIAALPIRH